MTEIIIKIKIKGKESDSKFYLKSLLEFLKNSNQFLKIEDYEFFNHKRRIILNDNEKKIEV
jgi:hypothetical protein